MMINFMIILSLFILIQGVSIVDVHLVKLINQLSRREKEVMNIELFSPSSLFESRIIMIIAIID